jgi:hypothetical protein
MRFAMVAFSVLSFGVLASTSTAAELKEPTQRLCNYPCTQNWLNGTCDCPVSSQSALELQSLIS